MLQSVKSQYEKIRCKICLKNVQDHQCHRAQEVKCSIFQEQPPSRSCLVLDLGTSQRISMSRDTCCAADAFHIMTGEIWRTYRGTSKNGTLWNTIEMRCHQSQQWNSYYVVMQHLNQFRQSWAQRFSNPRCGESSFTWVFTVCLFVSMVIRPRLLLPVTPVCSDEQRTQWVIETNELLQLPPIKSKLEG